MVDPEGDTIKGGDFPMFNFVMLEIQFPGFVAGVSNSWCRLVVPPGNYSGVHGILPNLLAKLEGQFWEPVEGVQTLRDNISTAK